MKINVSNILEDGLHLQFDKDGEWFHNLLPEKEKNDFSLRRVEVSCSIKKLRETVFWDGTLETTVTTNCCRCLSVASLPVKSQFRYTLVPAKEVFKEEQELSSDDLELIFYRDDLIDLDNIIFEQIMLQIPVRVLCKDTCKGLCPVCGADLNAVNCDCQTEIIDERLAVLKKLKLKRKDDYAKSS